MKRYLLIVMMTAILVITSSQVVAAAPETQGGAVHYVAWGESLAGIAARYGVSIEAIMAQNNIINPDMIFIGQPLVIPGGAPGPIGAGCVKFHVVKMGDTLSGIAWYYNTTVPQLLQMNNLYNKDMVYLGQRICVPGGYAPQPVGYTPPGATYYHTVTPGETLSGIAYRYGVNYWSIMQVNSLTTTVIWIGQQLVIPGHQPGAQPPEPCCNSRPAPRPESRPLPPPVYEDRPSVVVITDPQPSGDMPAAPDYQAGAVRPALPMAEHPIEVVVNGGENWVDDVYPTKDDPNSITTLIVQTGEENGKTVHVRGGDMESKGESSFNAEFGVARFVFRYIPPGEYDVWIDDPDTPSEIAQVKVGAGQRVEAAFRRGVSFQGQTYASPDGWVLSGWDNPSKPHLNIGGWSNIMIKTPASGLNIIAESEGGGYKAKCFTGSKGPGMCDFAGLMAGIYYIWIDGTQLKLKTYMDGNAYATFEFAHQ